jgi:hypothetical protein
MGYSVYRVKNKEVESSPFDVVGRIVDRYYQIMEFEGEEKIHPPKIKKIYNASTHEPLPEDLGTLIPAWTDTICLIPCSRNHYKKYQNMAKNFSKM